jgi:hypothetical protein
MLNQLLCPLVGTDLESAVDIAIELAVDPFHR